MAGAVIRVDLDPLENGLEEELGLDVEGVGGKHDVECGSRRVEKVGRAEDGVGVCLDKRVASQFDNSIGGEGRVFRDRSQERQHV